MWQGFCAILGDLVKQYDLLIRLADKKRAALASLDLETVDKVRRAEEKTIAAIEEIEQRRLGVLKSLSALDERISASINRRELYLYAPGEFQPAIKKISDELSRKTTLAKLASDGNVLLLRAALDAVTYKLNRIGQTEVNQNYGPGGTQDATSHRRSFDFGA